MRSTPLNARISLKMLLPAVKIALKPEKSRRTLVQDLPNTFYFLLYKN